MHTKHSLFNRSLFLVYLVILVWAPLPLGSNRPWAWALLEVCSFSLAAMAMLGWAIKPSGVTRALRREWPLLALLLLWLGYLGLQMITLPLSLLESLAPANAQWWLNLPPSVAATGGRLAASLQSARVEGLKHCMYVVFFCLTLLLVDSDKRLGIVIYTMVAAALFEAAYGLAAHFLRDSFPFWRPEWFGHNWASGTFINKNHYAAHLSFAIALTLGVCLAYVARRPYRALRLSWRALLSRVTEVLLDPGSLRFGILLVLLTAFFFAQSRGAFLGLAVAGGGLLGFGLLWRETRPSSKEGARPPSAERRVIPWVFLVGITAALWLSSSGLFARLTPTALADPGRVNIWRQSLAMWGDHWLFGVGNGSFQTVVTSYRTPELDGLLYDYVHNDHLQLLVEQGLVGAVLFYAFFFLCCWRMLRAYCLRGYSKRKQSVLLGILIAVSAFFLHGLVDFNFHIPANALWFYTLLGLGLVSSAGIRDSRFSQLHGTAGS